MAETCETKVVMCFPYQHKMDRPENERLCALTSRPCPKKKNQCFQHGPNLQAPLFRHPVTVRGKVAICEGGGVEGGGKFNSLISDSGGVKDHQLFFFRRKKNWECAIGVKIRRKFFPLLSLVYAHLFNLRYVRGGGVVGVEEGDAPSKLSYGSGRREAREILVRDLLGEREQRCQLREGRQRERRFVFFFSRRTRDNKSGHSTLRLLCKMCLSLSF